MRASSGKRLLVWTWTSIVHVNNVARRGGGGVWWWGMWDGLKGQRPQAEQPGFSPKETRATVINNTLMGPQLPSAGRRNPMLR